MFGNNLDTRSRLSACPPTNRGASTDRIYMDQASGAKQRGLESSMNSQADAILGDPEQMKKYTKDGKVDSDGVVQKAMDRTFYADYAKTKEPSRASSATSSDPGTCSLAERGPRRRNAWPSGAAHRPAAGRRSGRLPNFLPCRCTKSLCLRGHDGNVVPRCRGETWRTYPRNSQARSRAL